MAQGSGLAGFLTYHWKGLLCCSSLLHSKTNMYSTCLKLWYQAAAYMCSSSLLSNIGLTSMFSLIASSILAKNGLPVWCVCCIFSNLKWSYTHICKVRFISSLYFWNVLAVFVAILFSLLPPLSWCLSSAHTALFSLLHCLLGFLIERWLISQEILLHRFKIWSTEMGRHAKR